MKPINPSTKRDVPRFNGPYIPFYYCQAKRLQLLTPLLRAHSARPESRAPSAVTLRRADAAHPLSILQLILADQLIVLLFVEQLVKRVRHDLIFLIVLNIFQIGLPVLILRIAV